MQLADSICIPACGRADMWLFGPRLVAISFSNWHAVAADKWHGAEAGRQHAAGGGKYHRMVETGKWHVAEADR